MSDYQTLFDIHIEHDFFLQGVCCCLEFVPTGNTVVLLRNTGLLVKKSSRGLLVAYDRNRQESLHLQLADAGVGLDLVFKVYAKDPQFMTYTEPFVEPGDGMLYFTNPVTRKPAGAPRRIQQAEQVSHADVIDMDSEQLVGILDRKDRLIPPLCVVRIHADERNNPFFDKALNAKAPSFYLSFATRSTYWKYFLQSDKENDGTFVFDPDGRIEFESTGLERMADGRAVSTFRSKQSIPLQESFDFRFQLKQRSNGVEKVLFRQLPFARVGQTGKEVVAKQAIAVSEIYINY